MEAHGLLDIRRVPRISHFRCASRLRALRRVGVGQFDGTISNVARTAHHVAASPNDTLCLFLNRGQERVSFSHSGREGELDPAGMTLFRDWEAGRCFRRTR